MNRPSATEYDDITWRDAWDTDDVLKELADLANRMQRRGMYDECSLLLMVCEYIREREEA